MADDKDSAAAAVKSRRASKPRATTSTEAQEETAPWVSASDMGVTSDSIGAATLTGSFIAGHTATADYVIATADAYEASYPRGAMQPTCVKLWSRGQQVHKTHYAAHGGANAAATPATAKPVNAPGGGIHEAAGLTTAIR